MALSRVCLHNFEKLAWSGVSRKFSYRYALLWPAACSDSGKIVLSVGVHFGPWSLRSLVTSVLRPNWISSSDLVHFGPWSLRP